MNSGAEIRCSESLDDKWWFFFCKKCKNARPHIIGVLRSARIYLSQEQHTNYITDSENESYNSECSATDSAHAAVH